MTLRKIVEGWGANPAIQAHRAPRTAKHPAAGNTRSLKYKTAEGGPSFTACLSRGPEGLCRLGQQAVFSYEISTATLVAALATAGRAEWVPVQVVRGKTYWLSTDGLRKALHDLGLA